MLYSKPGYYGQQIFGTGAIKNILCILYLHRDKVRQNNNM